MRTVLWMSTWMAATALGGCGVEDERVGAEAAAIQGGARDASDPAVGMVWIEGGGFCSGTLIAPDVVLTAGHCVEDAIAAFETGSGGAGAPDVGEEPIAGFVAHAVIDQVAHPSYRSEDACPNSTFDVGLVRLARPITSVKPLAIAARPPARDATCRTVGYGVHNSSVTRMTVEQKRSATERVLAVDGTSVKVTRKSGIVDHGDSGGPLLCAGRIAGVTSCGSDGVYPHHRVASYARVDTVDDWIQQTIASWR